MSNIENIVNYNEIFNEMKIMFLLINNKGIILDINNQALSLLGYKKSDLQNNGMYLICRDRIFDNLSKENIKKQSVNFICKNGHIIPLNLKITYFDTENSNIIMLKLEEVKAKGLVNFCELNNNLHGDSFASFIKDTKGKYVFINSKFENLFRIKREKIIGKDSYEVWNDDRSYKWEKEDLFVINTKDTFTSFESMIVDDDIKYYEIQKSPVKDNNENIIGVYGIIRDMTEDIRLKNDLMIQNEQLSILYKIMCTATNLNVEQLFDYLRDTLNGLFNIDWITVYLYNEDSKENEYLISKGISKRFYNKYILTKKNLSYINYIYNNRKSIPMSKVNENMCLVDLELAKFEGVTYLSSYPLLYNDECMGVINYGSRNVEYTYSWDNQFIELVSNTVANILKITMMYEKLEKNLKIQMEYREKLDLYFDTTLDFFCIIDSNGKFVKVGKRMTNELGWTEEEVCSKYVCDFIHEKDSAYIKTNDLFENFESGELCVRFRCKDDRYITIDWNIKFLKDADIYICSGRNLTDKILLEQKKKLIDEYINIEKVKSEFLSNVAHELRTPISIIYGSVHMIENRYNSINIQDGKITNYLKTTKKNTFRLIRLINNMLDITNYDAGCLSLDSRIHNIVKVFKDITISMTTYLKGRSVNLVFVTDLEERYMYIDVNKIERIMLNLISNSVKYSKENVPTNILIKMYEENSILYVRILDNGIGLNEEEIPCLFDRFKQLGDIMTRKTEGSGMGLYLVKALLQMQNANISINSQKTDGAEFIIEFYGKSEIVDKSIKTSDKNYDVKSDNFYMEFSDIY
ncbi:PAS domain S-box protein [Sedimentibacter sp. zth1]|uniref:PAS domain S-box protein n=1 Tax=Sedimentibacter sp. zth1 TaxID=2816908 RepID=UPI001A91DD83|nr:PAS domain S-box protein [Sedimentibacter sp. zth1]QSX05831.1 PAS domain S-box protein [Sedimentibacter sp. zth1]